MTPEIRRYLQEIENLRAGGQASEHTYHPALQALIVSFAADIVVTNEPTRIRCGAPDFIPTRGPIPVGYVEAQDIGSDLDAAARIKSDAPVMVILGNPPYSGHSENQGEWISGLMRGQDNLTGKPTPNYLEVDGQPLAERNPKWLNDDYVKFIRFAQWRIEQTGDGILAFISNHGYLDNPTFRGMRQCLMKTFDKVYLLDLHGNAKKKKTAPEGSKDENVFDIQQGVAIGIFVKSPANKRRAPVVKHAHLYGVREVWQKDKRGEPKLVGGKYRWLNSHSIKNTRWTTVKPRPPLYLFIPQERRLQAEYEKGWKITDAMPVHSVGIVTARDELTVQWTPQQMWKTIREFLRCTPEAAQHAFHLRNDTRDWKISLAQDDLKRSGSSKNCIRPVAYRPFDIRYTYYTERSRGFICRPRSTVMRHMITGENMGLFTCRQTISRQWLHVLAASLIPDFCYVSHATRVAINAMQHFDKVPEPVWAFRIGGYQVCEKWLKDRKGRVLSHDEIMLYQQVVSALAETLRLMAEVDRAVAQSGNWPLE